MGYTNERASLNQFSDLYKYCKDHVMDQIKTVYLKNAVNEAALLNQELPFMYESLKKDDVVPLVSFDGGLATIFSGELSETKLIKVAGAAPPKWEKTIVGIQSSMFHVLSGVLKWPEGAGLTQDEIINQTIDDSLKVDVLVEMLDHLGISADDYKNSMVGHLKYKQGNQVEDCYREILEWALIVNCTYRQKNNDQVDHSQSIPYLIVKDGSLYPFAKSISELMSKEIEKFLNTGDCPIVGMVKASRFLAEDSSYRKSINKYLKKLKNNTFFQIPKKLEAQIDHRTNFYERFFFSLFGGATVFEIQIPKVNTQKEEGYSKKIMDILNSQVTLNYGGSLSTNSYAHIQASLAENEAKALTQRLKADLSREKGGSTNE